MRYLLLSLALLCGSGQALPADAAKSNMAHDTLLIIVNDAVAHSLTFEEMTVRIQSALDQFYLRKSFSDTDYRALALGLSPYLNVSLDDKLSAVKANLLQHRVTIVDQMLMARQGWNEIPANKQQELTLHLLKAAMPVVIETLRASEHIEGKPGPYNVVTFDPNDGGMAQAKQAAVNNLARVRALNARTRAELKQTMRRFLTAPISDGQIESVFAHADYPRDLIPELTRWIAGN